MNVGVVRQGELAFWAGDLEFMLCDLNEGLKGKEAYGIDGVMIVDEDRLVVVCAANGEGDRLFNVFDVDGGIPEGFSPCWRVAGHVFDEIGNKKNK